MKYFAMTAVFLVCLMSVSANAQQKTAQQLATSVAEAFAGKTMAGLDTVKPYRGPLSIIIEPSLGGRRSTRSFTSFAKADVWLTGREKEGLPSRNANSLKQCKAGVCTFDVSSLLHNNLYIKKITYSSAKGRVYIKSVTILDGN